jgi:prepilin-type N-terminal cleavage/methylation domain-containing protein
MAKRGFTLIELLVAMAILAILATIGFGNFQSTRIKANDVKRKSDLATIAKSLEAYVNDHRAYPLSDSGKIVCQDDDICDWGQPFTDGTSVYAAILPAPASGDSDYVYVSTGSSYSLYTRLENENDPDIDESIVVSCATSNVTCNYKVSSSNVQ